MSTATAQNDAFLTEEEVGLLSSVLTVPASVTIPISGSASTIKKPLTLDHLRKRSSQKPLIKVEISSLSEGETLICYRRDNIPAYVVEEFRKKGEDRDILGMVLNVVSEFTLDAQGQPLGTREEWAEFDVDTLNTILSSLFESSNKAGEA